MNIILVGISNVGKTVTGQLLAKKLGYDFYDLDEEVKRILGITLEEFVNTGTLFYRDQVRCELIHKIIKIKSDKVFAVTPLSYIDNVRRLFSSDDVLMIHLQDSAQHIFDRLVFSDENDNVYKDDEYKNRHRNHYLSEIEGDISWYDKIFTGVKNKFNMAGDPTEVVVARLISEYKLKSYPFTAPAMLSE